MDANERERIIARLLTEQAERRRLLVGCEPVVDEIVRLLFERDPVGINYESNTDEYEPEAETITLRLADATSIDEVSRIVHEEFVRWFGAEIAGRQERYEEIAEAIWDLWQRFSAEPSR